MALTLSCSGGEDVGNESGNNYSTGSSSSINSSSSTSSSSSSGNSSSSDDSSSSIASSSSSTYTDKGNSIANYNTVSINGKLWMAENLDYNVSGSKCYDNNQANCGKYGRLYDWATAMALPSSCNSNSCSGHVSTNHRGICPSGWHIPSKAEWVALAIFAGGTGTDGKDGIAGTKLKAKSGWNTSSGYKPGTDDYGFFAMPGGRGNSGGGFYNVGNIGYWWSSSDYTGELGSLLANSRYTSYGIDSFRSSDDVKDALYSVRCVKD